MGKQHENIELKLKDSFGNDYVFYTDTIDKLECSQISPMSISYPIPNNYPVQCDIHFKNGGYLSMIIVNSIELLNEYSKAMERRYEWKNRNR